MQLVIFRHGIAEDHGPDGTDASRRLTEVGVQRTALAARGLATLIAPPDTILTSPLVRARQTADLAGEVFDVSPQVLDALAYGPADAVIEELRPRRELTLMLVGHEPTLSEMVSTLCAGARASGFVRLKKAGCALVESDINIGGRPGQDVLNWLASPKMLRGLAPA